MELQLIMREIKIHSKLDHPHIVKLWDTIYDDGTVDGSMGGARGSGGNGERVGSS